MSKPVFTIDDWEALCQFLEQQRWGMCPSRLIPERFKVMVAPETLDQRKAVGVVEHRLSDRHRSGWRVVKGWRDRLAHLRAHEAKDAPSA